MYKYSLLLLSLFFYSITHAQLNIDFLGQLEYGVQLSNLTGWADGAGNEYAIVGTEDGTSIVDITDPTTPEEVQFIDGVNSIWREVRTWENYAYVVTEGGGGLLCIDLSGLPDDIDYNLTDCGVGLSSGHTVFCDENGIVHVFGSNLAGGGDIMFNADVANPLEPEYVGEVPDWYIHDGYVRGDTLWAGNIYEGHFSVWDLSDKTDPELLATQNTPHNFTHNTWLSDDGNYLFTTDEVTNATVASYDVSDLTDIQELDQFRANPGTNSIPHNTFVFGDFLVTAYYRDGVVITDATNPDILIKTGEYDTSPLSGDGFNGAWGCWPYLPSGNIIVSDMGEGLFILGPTYVHACYIEGNVTDASTGANIFGAAVEIVTTPVETSTDIVGHYASGLADEGTYDITFSKTGYESKTVTGVNLTSGDIVVVDVELEPLGSTSITSHVVSACSGVGIAGATVVLETDGIESSFVTDASGNLSLSVLDGTFYNVSASKWGYKTNGLEDEELSASGTFTIELDPGYYDDFVSDQGWTNSSTASTGDWVSGEPVGTITSSLQSNPETDVDDDFGNNCYVTGNGGGDAGFDDVDEGSVQLMSPMFSLTGYINPVISFYYWFQNDGGTGTPNDNLTITISNGTTEEELVQVDNLLDEEGQWLFFEGEVEDYISLSSTMQLIITTGDTDPGHIVEAAFDKFSISAPPALEVTATAGVGTATAVIDGGIAPYSVLWDDAAAQTTETATGLAAGTYTVTVTDANGCMASASVTIQDVAIDNLLPGFAVSLYPNPVSEHLLVHVEYQNTGSMSMIVEDAAGKKILGEDILEGVNSVSVSALPAGMYVVKILVDGKLASVSNIVKQ